MPEIDTTVSYNISFDTANMVETELPSVTKNKNEQFTKDDIPEYTVKDGYALDGWYFDSAYTKSFSSFYVTKDTRLYAKFVTSAGQSVKTYTVTYVNSETAIDSQNTSGLVTKSLWKIGDGITRGVRGKLFCGWFYDDAYSKPVLFGDRITEDKTFYAKWIALSDFKSDTTLYNKLTVAGSDYSDMAERGVWFTRSDEKDTDIGSYLYTKVDSFTSGSAYHTAAGSLCLGGVSFWCENPDIAGRINTASSSVCVDNKGLWFGGDASISGSNVDLSSLRNFALVTITKGGTLTANIKNAISSSCTTTNAKAYLVDENGNVLASQAIDNRRLDNGGSGSLDYTLTANVSSGNVYLVFSRNGDGGGGIYLTSFEYTVATPTTASFNLGQDGEFGDKIKNLQGCSKRDASVSATMQDTFRDSDYISSIYLSNDETLTESGTVPALILLSSKNSNMGTKLNDLDINSRPHFHYRFRSQGISMNYTGIKVSDIKGKVKVTVKWRNRMTGISANDRYIGMKVGSNEVVYKGNKDASAITESSVAVQTEQEDLVDTYDFGAVGGNVYISTTNELVVKSIIIETAE